MLLVVTHRGDATARFAESALLRRQVEYFVLDTDRYPEDIRISTGSEGASLVVEAVEIVASDISTIWWRRPRPPYLRERSPAVARWAREQSVAALDGFLEAIPRDRWVNHPSANRRGENKPSALRAAAALGFDVPSWVVTNDRAVASEFLRRAPHGVVTKSLVRARVNEALTMWTTTVSREQLSSLGPEPYLFQALVPNEADVRITVVGSELFAVEIRTPDSTSTLDWRSLPRRDLRHRAIELPSAVATRCVDLARHFGLRFAAIDLIRSPDGQLSFVDLNPNGQWAWIEEETGLPIADALAAELDDRVS